MWYICIYWRLLLLTQRDTPHTGQPAGDGVYQQITFYYNTLFNHTQVTFFYIFIKIILTPSPSSLSDSASHSQSCRQVENFFWSEKLNCISFEE